MKTTEDQECQALVQWLEINGLTYFHIANENKLLSMLTAKQRFFYNKKLKSIGYKPGIPDYFIVVPCKGGSVLYLWIEMKIGKNKPTENQKYWIELLNKLPSMKAVVTYGCNEAIKLICNESGGIVQC